MFVDECFSSHSNIKDLLEITNNEIKSVFAWFTMNELSLNADQTKYIFFHKHRDKFNIPLRLPNLKTKNICLKRVNKLKLWNNYLF